MGHNQRDTLKDYRSTLEQYFIASYRNTVKWDRFYHIYRFLYFSDNNKELDKTWKLRTTVENESYIWQAQ
jgi:hypothetical protein